MFPTSGVWSGLEKGQQKYVGMQVRGGPVLLEFLICVFVYLSFSDSNGIFVRDQVVSLPRPHH